jgi:hypothetical protein
MPTVYKERLKNSICKMARFCLINVLALVINLTGYQNEATNKANHQISRFRSIFDLRTNILAGIKPPPPMAIIKSG